MGFTDDTAAIQQALNNTPSGGTIYFSVKTYLSTSLTVQHGRFIRGAIHFCDDKGKRDRA
jgi:polygalacturonase